MDLKITRTYQIIPGKIAHQWLSTSDTLTISGITSAGLFMKTTAGMVIFFTTSDHFGPVNIVIDKELPATWKNGATVFVKQEKDAFLFQDETDSYELTIKSIWEAPLRPPAKISPDEQLSRMRKSAQQLLILKNGAGLSSLLLPYLEQRGVVTLDSEWLSTIWQFIKDFQVAIKTRNLSQILNRATQFIGSGRGLTPSGDDLLAGFVLMHQRWFNGADWFTPLYQELVDEFNQKTTAVSSTLFYCATLGEADNRIIKMADALMNLEYSSQNLALELARWGNSSGADIFLGLIMAINCFQEETRE